MFSLKICSINKSLNLNLNSSTSKAIVIDKVKIRSKFIKKY